MQLFINTAEAAGKTVALGDLILTKNLPTTGGSMMMDGFMSLFEGEVVTRLEAAGYTMAGKANMGEMGADLLGETSYYGAVTDEAGNLADAACQLVKAGEVTAAVDFDVNGTPRRGAACAGITCLKPTYGTVSRFGTIAIACSGEAVTVTAADAEGIRPVFDAIAGHDDKDGTSLPQEEIELVKSDALRAPVKKVAIAKSLTATADEDMQAAIAAFAKKLEAAGVETAEVDDELLNTANAAWNILFSAELCNNVSRMDGVKYGHRTDDYLDIEELYTNSRTEAFGSVLKTVILFGSDTLSTDNYGPKYDKALRIRRLLVEWFDKVFGEFDAVLLPAAGKTAFSPADVAADKYLAYTENRFTAPASITGLPAVVTCGVQLMGPTFADQALLDLAAAMEKEA